MQERITPLPIAALLVAFAAILASATNSQAVDADTTRMVLQPLRRLKARTAHQAVAVDVSSLFAISNREIVKHDKKTGQAMAEWKAPAGSHIKHLNSGVVIQGKLYCTNSNWPTKPLKNSLEIFDADSLQHLESKVFRESSGAINWIDRHRGAWYIVYAYYGDEVEKTKLVCYDDSWKAIGEWTFPRTVTKLFAPNSNSGGAFGPNGRLYVSGHDHAELYVLESPQIGRPLRHLATVPTSSAGQGIAWDRSDIGVLWGIVRKTHEMVSMRLSHALEFAPLMSPVKWKRDPRNPVLPPRKNEFDATRCMNPWVVRSGDEYRLYYSGGDLGGRQQIGLAIAAVDNLQNWRRQGPLFGNGASGSFDARWCVLPHVVQAKSGQWRMYYTGNAGRGSGLSAFPGIGLATSKDGLQWQRSGAEPVLAPSGRHGDPDAVGIAGGSLLLAPDGKGGEQWRFYYTGCPTTGKPHALNQQKTICLAVSDDGVQWSKLGAVMLRDPKRDYENIGVAGPVVHFEDGRFRMWYSAIGSRWGYYCICYAESDDGIHWRRGKQPEDNLQLAPQGNGWEKQMVEYPTVIREGNRLRLFYCGNGYGRSGIGTAVSVQNQSKAAQDSN